ncbi:MAG: DNA polymerase III subunit gamma/tau [Coxiellaceae bacterium]|jgi:DNA polymerase-3 subunit gamma/tau|nr:DNA polymerase III subunit gamma/tau [Coxiellaceae bacterium]
MSYQVLARKWRPKNFSEVIGQKHVTRALKNALTQKRLHHAYLFSGTRGVGKTTIARILAKCFNCETGVTATPCGRCDACTEIDTGRFIDLIEVDAASRTKVEDTRDLLDNVQYLPAKGLYKVYIIDEVHMLSGHSFNALLKTLEEPPNHIKFLLATTDPQKLPVTVLSRCLQFNLKSLTPELIQKQLQYVLNQEKISYEDEALLQLALGANGSVRDALSLLDQAIAFSQNKILTEDIKVMLGIIDTKKTVTLLEALATNNAKVILEIIAELAELAPDFINTIDLLLEILHQISLVQLIPNINTSNWLHAKEILQLASKFTPEETQLYYQIGLVGKRDIQLAPSPKSGFEMIMLRMLAFRPATITSLLAKATKEQDIHPKQLTSPNLDNCDTDILSKLEITGPTQALLQHCVVNKISNNIIELLLDPTQAPLLNKKHEERINLALSKYYNTPVTVNIKLGTIDMNTPTNIKKRHDTKKQSEAQEAIEKDPKIKELMNKFAAKVISNSIK